MQTSKSEERRKDSIARKTMMARRTALEATAAAKQEYTTIAEQKKDALAVGVALRTKLANAEAKCHDYAQQKSKLEEELYNATKINLDREVVVERMTMEKIQLSKMHSNEMKELVMRPTLDEVSVQLAELRGQLEEAVMTSEALKEALATSQLGS